MTSEWYRLDYKLTKDTTYFILSSELWNLYAYFECKWRFTKCWLYFSKSKITLVTRPQIDGLSATIGQVLQTT